MQYNPSLGTHPEVGDEEDNADDSKWTTRLPYVSPIASTPANSRKPPRHRDHHSPSSSPDPPVSQYTGIYSQFLQRYRAEPEAGDRSELEGRRDNRGIGKAVEDDDSDEDESARGLAEADRYLGNPVEPELPEPTTLEERERLEWQTMLASVLEGDVFKSEKTRIAVALRESAEEKAARHMNLWLALRAKLRGRSEDEERKRLEERKLRAVQATIDEVMTFRIEDSCDSRLALKQVNSLLQKLDAAHSLYPHLKAFYSDNPSASVRTFQERCDALNTWATVLTSLRNQINVLRKWTGSDTLDVMQHYTNQEEPLDGLHATRISGAGDLADDSTFVERMLKEDSIQRTFEKRSLTTVYALIGAARDAQVNLAPIFADMNIPTFETELVQLISFPTKLAEACLRLQLDHARKVKDPELILIDQLMEDFRLLIGFACTLKRQYEAFLTPDPGGNWNLPPCISQDYDSVVLEALSFFFRLLHWKLKSGSKGTYFKEIDTLEAQWATFNDVSLSTARGSILVAEQTCALTNKLMTRITAFFETQIRLPASDGHTASLSRKNLGPDFDPHPLNKVRVGSKMTGDERVFWYGKVLESVRQRYRKLTRFARVLTQRYTNSAEYVLDDASIDPFIATLVDSDHFLVYTQSFEEDGTYIVASPTLRDRSDAIRRIVQEAFHVQELWVEGYKNSMLNSPGSFESDNEEEAEDGENYGYVLIFSPRTQFLWNGLVLMLDIPKVHLDLKDNHVRLVADGSQQRLLAAKERFADVFAVFDDDGERIDNELDLLTCITEQQAHIPSVNREIRKVGRAINRIAEATLDSVHIVKDSLSSGAGWQELLENWFIFASEHGTHAQKYADRGTWLELNRHLIQLAISWVSFICDDCDPSDRKTFRWAVHALEFALHRTKRNILQLPEDQFETLRQKVASCMTLLISHVDVLGARSAFEAKKERERQEELFRQQAEDTVRSQENGDLAVSSSEPGNAPIVLNDLVSGTDRSIRVNREAVRHQLERIDEQRAEREADQRLSGRVLDVEKLEDRSLLFLVSSSSRIPIRWQQGKFIGAGAFGAVYMAVNLESGSIMAVKEIKFQELAGMPNMLNQIKAELDVMEMLHHPNIVEYYGLEVHRDKVYIFEEYCAGGSLASLLEHGRIEDESITQLYTMQMLEGIAYLHSQSVVHRDIKPDNILLDHLGVIKYADFGAAKIIARNRTLQRGQGGGMSFGPGMGRGVNNNSLTGTPMYMSPEVIKNETRGRFGAMDIWSIGCVVLECATGKKPWSNLDNEWAIMFQIGLAKEHPPLPEPGQLSDLGVHFIKQCLIIDPQRRPSAPSLMDHSWMLQCREALMGYEAHELGSEPPEHLPLEEDYDHAVVARQAAILQEREVEAINATSPSPSDSVTPPLDTTPFDPFSFEA